VGRAADLRLTLARTVEVEVTLRNFELFDDHVCFQLAYEWTPPKHPMPRNIFDVSLEYDKDLPDPLVLPPSMLRFGVVFEDGSQGTTIDGKSYLDASPEPPILFHGEGQHHSNAGGEMPIRLWPLPSGPFAFVIEWPLVGVSLSQIVVTPKELLGA
jgi:hypothetical protein